MKFKDNFATNVLFRSFGVLPASDRKKLPFVFGAQIFLSFLDLIGVAIIGVVGAIAVNGVKSGVPGNKVSSILQFINLESLTLQKQVSILGLAAATILVVKTIISALLISRTTYYLARRGALISSDLTHKLLSADSEKIRSRTPQENLFALTTGVVTIAVGIVATSISVFADTVLLLVLFSGLIIVDVKMATLTIAIFGFTAFLLYKLMHLKAKKYGELNATLSIENNQTILEALYSFREIFVRNQRKIYIDRISQQRMSIANISAGLANMPNLSKYAVEVTLVTGAVAMSAFQFMTQDAVHAVAVLSVFLAASSRIAPAVLRIQQGAIQVRGHIGTAEPTLNLISDLKNVTRIPLSAQRIDFIHSGFKPKLKLEDVSFKYSGSEKNVLSGVNFQVEEGETIAIVGPSGAGKSTLIDVILGILEPTTGYVTISGKSPIEAIGIWPGAISYLPQDVVLSRGTIKSNIAFGFDDSEIDPNQLLGALEIAQAASFIQEMPRGLDSQVSDRGDNFSGGQRQRLGIARALYTNPKLLVLDEVTSALDGDTEAAFTRALHELKGKTTVIIVAHRLSSVMEADRIFYMENGKILGIGKFQELKYQIPNFARQAEIMGL
jgi:ABC-type multidrug transport system fused ATPase/permease subunit